MTITFTEYRRPDAMKFRSVITRPSEIEELAAEVIAAGGEFSFEQLSTSGLALECRHGHMVLAIELAPNDLETRDAVDRLVRRAAEALDKTKPRQP